MELPSHNRLLVESAAQPAEEREERGGEGGTSPVLF